MLLPYTTATNRPTQATGAPISGALLGLDGLFDVNTGSLPLLVALGGSVSLAYGALLLSYEARYSAATTKEEMRFLEELGQHYAGLYADELS